MAQKRPSNYEAHLDNGESASNPLFFDLLSEHNDQDERLTESSLRYRSC